MFQTAKALYEFISSFDLEAFPNQMVPPKTELPYLTYPITEPEWDQQASFYIQGWYRTTDTDEMIQKCDQIIREIGTGIIINMDDGYLVIYPESPLVQFLSDMDNDTKSFYINLSINAYHMPGA